MGLLGRIAGLGRALITRGFAGSGGGASPVVPVVTICGDTVVGRTSRGRTAVARTIAGSCDVGATSTGATRVAPTIAGKTSPADC